VRHILLETMAKISAGLLLYRLRSGGPEVFLVHPGGPFWAKKDAGAWSIPKGEPTGDEALLVAAQRECEEETGLRVTGDFHALDPVRRAGGKLVHAWAVEADCDSSAIRSNTFEMEWPPRSGRQETFPEVDRAAWLDLPTARVKITKGQLGLLDQLERLLAR
jgi:predicted NUDIX family NTP pyrophosphohydrolase